MPLIRICLATLALAATAASAQRGATVNLVDAFPNLTFSSPVDMLAPPDGSDRLFVVEQFPGMITFFDNSPAATTKSTFLDLSDRVFISEEGGIIGLAFHPGFANNRHVFVTYAVEGLFGQQHSILSRFTTTKANPDLIDLDSEIILLDINTARQNHTMHRIVFGPDGYLYVSVGDGGCCGDPDHNAQDLTTLKGSILRLDVNNTSMAQPYSIPPTNPFAGNTDGHREEIFCYGLRNPWRFTFDSQGRLWIADVGQNVREEISWGHNGANLGWPIMEGFACYPNGPCDQTGLTLPLHQYEHQFNPGGGFAISGGYVYEGWNCGALHAKYLFADYISGNVWAMDFDDSGSLGVTNIAPLTGRRFSAFGRDAQGEIYIAAYDNDRIYRFESPGFCPADLAEPEGALDFSDVTAFLVAFATQSPAADLAPPAFVYDFSDVLAFLTAFAAGCP